MAQPSSPEELLKPSLISYLPSVMTLSGKSALDSDEFTELWWFAFSNGNWTPEQVGACPAFPARYQKHPKYNNFYRTEVSYSKHADIPNVADVHITYSSKVKDLGQKLSEDASTWIENPLKRLARISYETIQDSKNYDRARKVRNPEVDDEGYLVVPDTPYTVTPWRPQTKAGEFVALEDRANIAVINIEKDVAAIPAVFMKNSRFLNHDTVTINKQKYKPTTLMFSDYKVSNRKIEWGIPYFTFSFRLYHNPKGWYKRVDNVGTVGRLPKVTRIKSASGKYIYNFQLPQPGDSLDDYPVQPFLWGQPPERVSVPLPLDDKGFLLPRWYTLNQDTGRVIIKPAPKITDKELAKILDGTASFCYTAPTLVFADYLPLK